MSLSPFQAALPATHTGRNARTGRRALLVRDDGVYLTRTEFKARQSGFTREEDSYTDVLPLSPPATGAPMSTRLSRLQLDRERAARAGCVYLATSARTGALRGVYRAREAGIDTEGWATVCEDHATLVLSDTRALALASDTLDFCDDCRAQE